MGRPGKRDGLRKKGGRRSLALSAVLELIDCAVVVSPRPCQVQCTCPGERPAGGTLPAGFSQADSGRPVQKYTNTAL
jgi:hypothetical protein